MSENDGEKVLIFDRPNLAVDMIGDVLEIRGYKAMRFYDPQEAARFIQMGGKYDLAILNCCEKDSRGINLVELSGNINPKSSVVALSWRGEDKCGNRFFLKGRGFAYENIANAVDEELGRSSTKS